MQDPTTAASGSLDRFSNRLIDLEKKLVKPGIRKEGVTHLFCLLFFGENKETAPSDTRQDI
jgi:hypothetical protein